MDFAEILTPQGLTALFEVLWIDIVLAGDNAVVVGMAAAGLPDHLRRKAIVIGIGASAIMRILFALVASQMLTVIGLTLAGGVLLAWVAWKMWREIREQRAEDEGAAALADDAATEVKPDKTLRQAMVQIIVADLSMSLDNVLAVAGAAREHPTVLVIGLVLSVGLMGAASTVIARLLTRYHWIAYLGLAMIAWVAVNMIYQGGRQVIDAAALF